MRSTVKEEKERAGARARAFEGKRREEVRRNGGREQHPAPRTIESSNRWPRDPV